MTGVASCWRRGMKQRDGIEDSAESGHVETCASDARHLEEVRQELAELKAAIAGLEKRNKELNYVVYKLLYEMGGKEILDNANSSTS